MSLKTLTLALAAVACASPFESLSKATSDDPCEPCQPQGATGTTPPAIGSDLSSLYIDVLQSVKDIRFQERSVVPRAEGFCCRQSLDCVNVQNLNIAMCYDKFTTNFGFADGSYGSLTTGNYSSSGATVNLFTGDYAGGNIYASQPQDKPNTATLSIPPQWTGTGVGGPIPASQLGSVVVFTTTIPGTTITAPTTVPESVMVATISGKTVSTTLAPVTYSGATTIAPQTSTVTETAAAASSSSTGAAGTVNVDSTRSFGVSILSALMYAVYAW